jgi:hypothetical protein
MIKKKREFLKIKKKNKVSEIRLRKCPDLFLAVTIFITKFIH